MDGTRTSRRTGLWLALVLALAFGAYAPTLLNGYVWDDAVYVRARTTGGEANPMVAELRPVAEYFRVPMNHGASITRGFRPVTVYSYALVRHWTRSRLSGGVLGERWTDPAWPQHLANLLLHVLATALVFALARRFAGDAPALVAAAVFAVHALHTEAIAWIVGRGELLAFVCGAAGALAYARALGRRGARRALGLGSAAALLFLAFGSKESGVAWAGLAPLLAVALALRARADARIGRELRAQAMPWAVAVGLPLLAYLALRHRMLVEHVDPYGPFAIAHDHNPLAALGLLERLPSALMILGYGLYKVLAPFSLSCSYRSGVFELPAGWLDPRVLGAVAVLGGALWAAVRSGRRHPLPLLAIGAFLGLSFVTSNLAAPVETVFGERFYYAPSLGLALLLAWLWGRAGRSVPARLVLGAPLLLWLGACTWTSVERSMQWRDELTLFEADVRQQPECIELRVSLAREKFGNFAEAEGRAHLERALAVDPESTQALVEMATYVLNTAAWAKQSKTDNGAALARERFERARELIERIERSQHFAPAIDGRNVHVLWSRLHRELGDDARFEHHTEQALRHDPRDLRIRLALLYRARARGDTAAFERLLRGGERHNPGSPYLALVHGTLAHDAGRHDRAVELFAASLPQLPDHVHVLEAWCRYGRSLLALGRGAEALTIARHHLGRALPPDVRADFEHLASEAGARAAPR